MRNETLDNRPWTVRALERLEFEEDADGNLTEIEPEIGVNTDIGHLHGEAVKWERVHSRRRAKWNLLNEMRKGNQFADYNPDGTVRRAYIPEDVIESRLVFNHIAKSADTIRSAATRERPQYVYTVGSDESMDRAAARAADQTGQFIQREHDFETIYGDCVEGAFTFGSMFAHPWWDPNAGPLTASTVTDGSETDGEVNTQDISTYSGDLQIDVLTPDQVIYAPYATIFNKSEGLFIQRYLSAFECYRRFGAKVSQYISFGTPAESAHTLSTYNSNYPGIAAAGTEDPAEMALIWTFYLRACEEYPRGREVIFTKDVLISIRDNPYYVEEGESGKTQGRRDWPIFHYLHYRNGDDPYGRAGAEDMVDPQMALNGNKSKTLLMTKTSSHSILMAPKGAAHIDTDDPSSIIEYDRRFTKDQFGYLQPPGWPSELNAEAAYYEQALNDIPGTNDAVQGNADSDDSGRKVQSLQAAALGRFAQRKHAHDKVTADLLQYCIRTYARNLEDDRLVAIVGENNKTNSFVLKGSDLASSVDVFPVNNPLSSDMTQRSMQLQSMATTLGQIQDPVERQMWIGAYNMQDVLQVPKTYTVDREKALRENILIAQGREPMLDKYDNDMVHMAEHTAWGKSEEGMSSMIPEDTDPPEVQARKHKARQIYQQHCQAHEDQMEMKMNPQPQAPAGAPTAEGAPMAQAPESPMQQPAVDTPQAPVSAPVAM